MRFGMSEKLGPRVFGHDHGLPFLGREFTAEPDYSDEIAREIDDEIRRIVETAHVQAKEILTQHRDTLGEALGDPDQARDDREGAVRGAARRADRGRGLRRRGATPARAAGPAARTPASATGPRGPAAAAAPRPRRRHRRIATRARSPTRRACRRQRRVEPVGLAPRQRPGRARGRGKRRRRAKAAWRKSK